MCGIASVFLGGQHLNPLIMIKRVNGLNGCHGECLIFLVHIEFLLDVSGAQWR